MPTTRHGHAWLLVPLLLTGCSQTRPPQEITETGDTSDYDTAFPFSDASNSLDHLIDVTKKIFSQSHYRTWHFNAERQVTPASLDAKLLRLADEVTIQQHSVAGTATVVSVADTRIGLLSAAHIFDWPDTLYTYHIDSDLRKTDYLSSVAILESRSNFVQDIPQVSHVDLLAMDKEDDIALLGASIPREWNTSVPALRFPLGKDEDLRWGSFVYAVGYPGGHHMITPALVSKVSRDRRYSFIIDAPFNQGFSGGLVLAFRGGADNVEVVGLITSAASVQETVLAPPPDSAVALDAPYSGTIWAESRAHGRQSITFVSGADRIREVIQRERSRLRNQGYDFSSFMN
jgi:hypothetical protein